MLTSTTLLGGLALSTTLSFFLAAAILVLAPGFILSRLFLPAARTLAGQIGLAIGTGLIFSLLIWIPTVLSRLHWLPWILSGLTILLSLSFKASRDKVVQGSYTSTLSPIWHWLLAASIAVQASVFALRLYSSLPAPQVSQWYQDNYWHLSINAELTRQIIPDYPQVLGEPLNYHWLANAHMALINMSTGIAQDAILTRLWFWPILIGSALLAVALVERYCRRMGIAALSGVALMLVPSLIPARSLGIQLDQIWVPESPSQTFAIPMFLLTVVCSALLITRKADTPLRWPFMVIVAVVFLTAPGAKSSNLPLVGAAAALVLLVALILKAGRSRILGALTVLAASLLATLITSPVFAGSGSGTSLQLGSTIRRMPAWFQLTDLKDIYFSESPVLLGLYAPNAVLILILICVVLLGTFAWASPLIFALFSRDRSTSASDRLLIAWFLLGLGIAGFAATFIIDHDGLSQVYFIRTAAAALVCGAALGLERIMDLAGFEDASTTAQARMVAFTALCTIAAIIVLLWINFANPSGSAEETLMPLLIGLCLAAAVFALLWLFFLVAAVRGHSWAGRALLSFSLATLTAASLATPLIAFSPKYAPYTGGQKVSAPTQEALAWARANTPTDAVLATNLHCFNTKTTPSCDTRAFWVSALSERQTYLEGWGYSATAHKLHGVGGKIYNRQPWPDQQRFERNEKAVNGGDIDALRALAREGVTYVFALKNAAPVSPELSGNAPVVFENSDVIIVRIDSLKD